MPGTAQKGGRVTAADRDCDLRRITTAAAGLAAYRIWLAGHEAAWLAGGAPVPFDDRALD